MNYKTLHTLFLLLFCINAYSASFVNKSCVLDKIKIDEFTHFSASPKLRKLHLYTHGIFLLKDFKDCLDYTKAFSELEARQEIVNICKKYLNDLKFRNEAPAHAKNPLDDTKLDNFINNLTIDKTSEILLFGIELIDSNLLNYINYTLLLPDQKPKYLQIVNLEIQEQFLNKLINSSTVPTDAQLSPILEYQNNKKNTLSKIVEVTQELVKNSKSADPDKEKKVGFVDNTTVGAHLGHNKQKYPQRTGSNSPKEPSTETTTQFPAVLSAKTTTKIPAALSEKTMRFPKKI